jgi:hypothetical protein
VPTLVAVANLVFCAFFENPIKEDPTDRTLSLFLFIQGSMILLFTLAHLSATSTEILHKTLAMPAPPPARLAFVLLSSVLSPVLQALVFSDILFLLILHHPSVVVIVLIPLYVLGMAVTMIAFASVASAAATRRSRPQTEPVAYCILGILGIVLLSLYFHIPAILGFIPPMSWTAQGITAIVEGRSGLALAFGAACFMLLLVIGFWGRKIT